ncbi:hypothetical protein E2C01_039994 [Portunus trituberculatus]|uniref:Uncharacterized protein n=1 Tax=Portunus trituberculatus TaxID=210409 RepID=A0A5B7FM45_PORTR|nr:hypothetical protein [Portunus trituberculatus]
METTLLSEDIDAEQENNRNHGCRIDGPWELSGVENSTRLAMKSAPEEFMSQSRTPAPST